MENKCDLEMNDSESAQNSKNNPSAEVSKRRKIWDEFLEQDDEFLEQDDEFLEPPLEERKIDPELLHDEITRLVLRNGLPLRFVEYDEFRDLMSYLCPGFDHIDINTLMKDVQKLYDKECEKIKDLLKSSVERVSLSTELWTSITCEVYMSFTAHYIDKDWVLHKKLLGFCIVPAPHTNEDICDCITKMLVDWGIENKLFSITVDSAESNDLFVELLKNNLNLKNALLCNGELFHNHSCAHILNLIVQDTLKWIDNSIQLIRESVKYVEGSEGGKSRFFESCKQMGIPTDTGLHRDVSTRWISTYHMLESALFYQRAFLNLQLMDSNYKDCPSTEEWLKIEKIVKCLKPFNDVATMLSCLKYPTSNLNFLYAWMIHKYLLDEISSEDCFMKKVAEDMKKKYDKYWSDNNLILAIAMVFDPRYKFSFVKWVFSELSVNGSKAHEMFSHVKSNLSRFFQEYENMVDVGGPSNNDDGAVGVEPYWAVMV
ncbi:zinc finger BED domain-containing protein RICESLEEPER 2-like [Telopea speciosissima]|uniref:zinc finger BED domain-containing protein RICESLEEPER 2-like n=1 Tax=Telopea speciosissima TaxID=54955 RepID=UPI001CC5360A|nr:zinc finger BED domain-containing protein RICESLEEPER 2-like [Telopea speciosissima]